MVSKLVFIIEILKKNTKKNKGTVREPDQLVFGSGIGNKPALAPLGGENPKNFCKLVRMLMEQRKYKNAMEQSVGSSPCNPRWLIFINNPKGLKGNFATTLPSKRELSKPKTTKSTRATTAPDLNLKSERSRLDSLRLVSTRSIFLVLDFLVTLAVSVFMVSSFLEALSMEDRRDLQELVRQMRTHEIASQTMAVHIEMPTTLRLSEYLNADNIWGIAMETKPRKIFGETARKLELEFDLIFVPKYGSVWFKVIAKPILD